jgi:DNA-binding HxlR family transcriptional regulator
MTLLGKRCTGEIISTLMPGPGFFNELKRGIPGISDRVLNERLVELSDLQLVTRTVLDAAPIRVHYEPTEHGSAMSPAVNETNDLPALHGFIATPREDVPAVVAG